MKIRNINALTEVIRDIVAAEIHKRLLRCHACKHLFDREEVGVAGCACCYTGIFVYCRGCGGLERSKVSVEHHVKWYASKLGQRFDGGIHRSYWQAYRHRLYHLKGGDK